MKNKYKILALSVIIGVGFMLSDVSVVQADFCSSVGEMPGPINHDLSSFNFPYLIAWLTSQGYPGINCYACTDGTDDHIYCTSTVITTTTSYGAYQSGGDTLVGTSNNTITQVTSNIYYGDESPFIYFQNPPTGDISLSLNSQFNKYYPKPTFNQDNGWLVNSKDNKLTLNNQEINNLFYELEINKLTLNRNGRNFTSKEELSEYLQNSDFLTNLGFSELEKKNSLGYFLPKLTEAENNNFYYLTVLSDQSIAEISELNIKPTPKEIIRQYFAVYPTAVPVKTAGDFNFPENKNNNFTDFTVKETGEFLIQKSMQVFFE